MENFVFLSSTTNPVELEQMIFALERVGIPLKSKGKESLEIGNVELTGMSGASLYVPQEKLIAAKKTLVDSGLFQKQDLINPDKPDHFMRNSLIFLGVILIALLILGVLKGF